MRVLARTPAGGGGAAPPTPETVAAPGDTLVVHAESSRVAALTGKPATT